MTAHAHPALASFFAPYGGNRHLPLPEVSTDWSPDTVSGGLPADRSARMAARRAFVTLKLSFLYVVEGLDDAHSLKQRVRHAETPEDLWHLRVPVFAALTGEEPTQRSRRQLLNRSLESMFSDLEAPVN